jgi:hypothetical protein
MTRCTTTAAPPHEDELVELGVHCVYALGMGRLTATWDITDNLPDAFPLDAGFGSGPAVFRRRRVIGLAEENVAPDHVEVCIWGRDRASATVLRALRGRSAVARDDLAP